MKKLFLFLTGGFLLMSILVGCDSKNEAEIEQGFKSMLELYPTKNLEDFYDMEGFRDENFDNDDKGVWLLHSQMSESKSIEGDLHTEGMILRLNRNTRTAKGYYYTGSIPNDFGKSSEEKKYPVVYKDGKFQLVDDKERIEIEIKEKIQNFEFFVQYGEFKNLDTYKVINRMYNPEVPMYELEYQLPSNDLNVEQLKNRYAITTAKEPILLLKGQGDLEGSAVGYKQIEITFDKSIDLFFTDSIDFQPMNLEDI